MPIQRSGVLVAPVLAHIVVGFSVDPGSHGFPVLYEIQERHGITAGGLHHVYGHVVDLPSTAVGGKFSGAAIPSFISRVISFCCAIAAKDEGTAREGTPHERHAGILFEVTRRFIAGPCKVHPQYAVFTHDA